MTEDDCGELPIPSLRRSTATMKTEAVTMVATVMVMV
jgi:hypothetical protein